ncbi:MAG TPA: DinB family protein [Armatimonadota bacterium]|jgi:uncharacterized damage-inducible protein DinB
MNISDTLLPEFDMEMANTRKMLERVPEDKFGWRPHAKSMTLGELATHLTNLPSWVAITLTTTSFNFDPEDPAQRDTLLTSRQAMLEQFDAHVATGRAAIAAASDAEWMQSWALQVKGRTIFNIPRIAVLRGFVLSHTIHHRAQLGLYLRLNDIALPPVYGPTADEGMM